MGCQHATYTVLADIHRWFFGPNDTNEPFPEPPRHWPLDLVALRHLDQEAMRELMAKFSRK